MLGNKNAIIILSIFIAFMILCLTGCEVVEEIQTGEIEQLEEQKKLTKQVCDWTGWDSSSIIEEQAQQGYTFTGRTRGFMCENLLNFQLKEDK